MTKIKRIEKRIFAIKSDLELETLNLAQMAVLDRTNNYTLNLIIKKFENKKNNTYICPVKIFFKC